MIVSHSLVLKLANLRRRIAGGVPTGNGVRPSVKALERRSSKLCTLLSYVRPRTIGVGFTALSSFVHELNSTVP